MMTDLEGLILRKGLEAAIAERDSRRAALEESARDLRERLQEIEQGLRSIDEELVSAYRRASEKAGIDVGLGGPVPGLSPPGKTPNRNWVIGHIRQAGGEIKSPQLYRAWDEQRCGGRPGRRNTIYTVVSNLIRSGVLIKKKVQGESGSTLALVASRG